MLCKAVTASPMRYFAPVAKLGTYSYSIYLWHGWAQFLLPHKTPTECALAFIPAIAPGILRAHLVEIPALRLRERLAIATAP